MMRFTIFGAKSELKNAPNSKNLIVMRTFSKRGDYLELG